MWSLVALFLVTQAPLPGGARASLRDASGGASDAGVGAKLGPSAAPGVAGGGAAPTRGRTPQAPATALVAAARRFLGTPYDFGGRRRNAQDGIDCLGLVLAAWEPVSGCSWKSFPWNSTEIVDQRLFGAPVAGHAPAASADVVPQALRPGDFVMLLAPDENTREPALASLAGVPHWVWHVGLFTGGGKWIVGDHFAGAVVEVDLAGYLAVHADTYAGVYVVRPPGKAPRRCRKTPFMAPP